MTDPDSAVLESRGRVYDERSRRPIVLAGSVLGFGVGGLVDAIVLHLVFQHHHTVSG
ncbi:DUF2243 domain-containing protein [Halovivax sp.]|uniref:DUF2243 domain-containing protein n=1 Tax=Halovivax sp. TaxID=1935978 RepID=UPI0025C56AF5|nr:DUF2243 domain-containing protein [Halovivax sp.]